MSLSAEQEAFQASLETLYHQSAKTSRLQGQKEKAWERFRTLGLPSKDNEAYRYMRLRNFFTRPFEIATQSKLTHEDISRHIFPECTLSALVFVNGQYHPELSRTDAIPKRMVICSLTQAAKTYGTLLNHQWAKTIKEEVDPFVMLNTALHEDGLFLYIPPKTLLESPIQILHLISLDEKISLMVPRVHIFVGAQAQVDLVSSSVCLSGSSYCYNATTEIALEEASQVNYVQVGYQHAADAWCFEALRAQLKRNSTFKSVHLTNGCASLRQDYRITLLEENAEASLNGLATLSEKRESHVHVHLGHHAPSCRSQQLFKSVLNDFSRFSFEGKIYVKPIAQKTEAFQQSHMLLLHDHAQAYSKPNLEIFADDVKASHGATVGQLDHDQLFYLKTRGFSDAEAKKLLVAGFCKEIFEMIPIDSIVHEAYKKN